MPSVSGSFGPAGPVLYALIGVSSFHGDALRKAGLTVPQYVQGTFLLDTGASCTCVDPSLVQPLGLTATGVVGMHTPSTANAPVQCAQFDVSIYIPGAGGSQGYFIDALPVIETSFAGQGIDGLIGRDILDRCVLSYNGSAGIFTLSF